MRKMRDIEPIEEKERADEILQQLLHLKTYETPDPNRMRRNQQNIMRRIREEKSKHWSLSELIEVNMPWFFAEPRYGIALLFVAFAMLQFWGSRINRSAVDREGLYDLLPSKVTTVEQLVGTVDNSTNTYSYPELPVEMHFFDNPARNGGSVQFVGFEEK